MGGKRGPRGKRGRAIRGKQGRRGPTGEPGLPGRGIKGKKGEKGSPGEKGPNGLRGPEGAQGSPGFCTAAICSGQEYPLPPEFATIPNETQDPAGEDLFGPDPVAAEPDDVGPDDPDYNLGAENDDDVPAAVMKDSYQPPIMKDEQTFESDVQAAAIGQDDQYDDSQYNGNDQYDGYDDYDDNDSYDDEADDYDGDYYVKDDSAQFGWK